MVGCIVSPARTLHVCCWLNACCVLWALLRRCWPRPAAQCGLAGWRVCRSGSRNQRPLGASRGCRRFMQIPLLLQQHSICRQGLLSNYSHTAWRQLPPQPPHAPARAATTSAATRQQAIRRPARWKSLLPLALLLKREKRPMVLPVGGYRARLLRWVTTLHQVVMRRLLRSPAPD